MKAFHQDNKIKTQSKDLRHIKEMAPGKPGAKLNFNSNDHYAIHFLI